VRKETRWLALLLAGACGTVASAQSPLMYGMQPYPPYPYTFPQPVAAYPTPGAYAPPAYYPQPQPRVIYVPAAPTAWERGPAQTVQTLPAPGTNAAPAVAGPAADGSDNHTVFIFENGAMPQAPAVAMPDDDMNVLPKGRCNVQALGGVYSDIGNAHYNWAQTTIRLGKICGTGCLDHLPGAFEALVEVNGAATTQADFGSWFIGGGFLLRYNFVQPGSFLVPYVQAGVGFQYNDAFRDPNQPYLGSRIELTGQAQVGLRFHLCKNLSLDVEGGLIHISDLGMSSRDDGINALGGSAGLTYYFPCHGKH